MECLGRNVRRYGLLLVKFDPVAAVAGRPLCQPEAGLFVDF